MKKVITFGTFDVIHVGHLRMLKRCADYGDVLIVGVSTDALNEAKKGRPTVYTQDERLELVSSIRYVDRVFLEESLEKKREYVTEYEADVLVMGDDWEGRFDDLKDVCEVIYLPRTPAISTTALIEKIRS